MISEELAQRCSKILVEKHAQDVYILDLRGLTDIADYFVLASANSEPHIHALVESLREFLDSNKETNYHIEGTKGMRWVIFDTFDVIVHIFLPEIREYYDLESYWGDAPVIVFDENDEF